ncbi:hypothetical protein LOTGIDRAFT_157076 [Lottia gigantea]|uniref:RBR-type E3 ubiquitin transferase n=1 Tax=Lottia gigantea TaxID=225164 RepID=V4B3K3_LOTGI|nr:hypothetical protein LOTGIDRAFT_157076 [Lottia gigantea]ESP01946.1 hypothetical protein LOTGIDRAFT_157076 [Lottia gigantea]
MGDLEEQQDELLALESIYDSSVLSIINEADDKGGQFDAKPHLPEPFYIQSDPIEKGCHSKEDNLQKIQYLPPVTLNFQLPIDYPSTSSPEFTLTCKWLTHKQLSKVCKRLDELWEENTGTVILFTWINFLHEELYDFLQLSSPLDIRNIVSNRTGKSVTTSSSSSVIDKSCDLRCIQDIESQDWLLVAILDYDSQMKTDVFNKSVFLCNVCFQTKPGSSCFQFNPCCHIFCRECMRDYFEIQIDDGNVQGLICPHDKCESEAHPCQVKNLVPEEKYSRYDELLLSLSLDMMMDIMYCPRRLCQCPVMLEKDCNIGQCPSCQFVFCRLCKLVYHGLTPCKLKANELKTLKDEYENADSEGKKLLEKKYGKRIIEQALEESITREWLENYTKPCPACGFHIEKADGCNKMTCTKCKNYFCWLCGDSLSRTNPYSHYNIKGPCTNRLFEGMENEFDFDDPNFDWF